MAEQINVLRKLEGAILSAAARAGVSRRAANEIFQSVAETLIAENAGAQVRIPYRDRTRLKRELIEAVQAGATVAEACRAHGVSRMTFYRWTGVVDANP